MTNKNKQVEHTPVPWTVGIIGSSAVVENVDAGRTVCETIYGVEDARTIVNCVNNHTKLQQENEQLRALVDEIVGHLETLQKYKLIKNQAETMIVNNDELIQKAKQQLKESD